MGQEVTLRHVELRDLPRLMELRRRQTDEWFGDIGDEDLMPYLNLQICGWVAEYNGEVVAYMGARRAAEGMAILDTKFLELDKLLRLIWIPLFARLAVELRGMGYLYATSRVGNVIKKWGNMLVRRFGFERDPTFRFDLLKGVPGKAAKCQ